MFLHGLQDRGGVHLDADVSADIERQGLGVPQTAEGLVDLLHGQFLQPVLHPAVFRPRTHKHRVRRDGFKKAVAHFRGIHHRRLLAPMRGPREVALAQRLDFRRLESAAACLAGRQIHAENALGPGRARNMDRDGCGVVTLQRQVFRLVAADPRQYEAEAMGE